MKSVLPSLSLLFAFLITGCSTPKPKSLFDRLLEYEGRYEYIGTTTLELMASELDTTLYAIVDGAKYPLTYIQMNSFTNIQDEPIVFIRDAQHQVSGYQADGQTFKLISRDFEKPEMLPRRALFKAPDNYAYQPPKALGDGIAVGNLLEAFEDPKPILTMVKETIKGNYPEVHSILIYKKGQLVLEEYFYGYDQHTIHQLRSAGKALKGGILGIAIAQGYVKSEKDPLLPYFKEQYPTIANVDQLKEQITIEDFLRYRHGMDCENNNPKSQGYEQAMMQSDDWVKHTLDLPMVQEPGQASSYCTGCSITINSLIEQATGQQIEAFAKQHLFAPLGISNYKWTFEPNPSSIATFNQLYMTPRDLLKMAILYKNGGKWHEQQIIPEDWIQKTFTMDKGDYGYFWENKYYNMEGKTYNSYLATGNGGQKIQIWPEQDMITIFTGGNYNSYAIYGKSTPPNEMIPKYLLPSIQ